MSKRHTPSCTSSSPCETGIAFFGPLTRVSVASACSARDSTVARYVASTPPRVRRWAVGLDSVGDQLARERNQLVERAGQIERAERFGQSA